MRSSSFCMTMLLALVVILLASLAMTAARTEPVKEYLGRAQMRTFGEPSQLLGSDKDLVLLLVSKHLWPRGNWKCMKSRFVSTETTNVSFIREEHFWIPPHQTSNATSAPKPGNLTFRYDVIRNTSDYTKVNTTYITESKFWAKMTKSRLPGQHISYCPQCHYYNKKSSHVRRKTTRGALRW
ncbi:uncharacterized protein LOC142587630 isoform X3 [Dermacentor variabilis]|uniref:uncharacterized protein LOC142587630 isoform X3 n=1 Tax=Dermacentor variabilis TaxID=34621 RepID=UPI003F5B325E